MVGKDELSVYYPQPEGNIIEKTRKGERVKREQVTVPVREGLSDSPRLTVAQRAAKGAPRVRKPDFV